MTSGLGLERGPGRTVLGSRWRRRGASGASWRVRCPRAAQGASAAFCDAPVLYAYVLVLLSF